MRNSSCHHLLPLLVLASLALLLGLAVAAGDEANSLTADAATAPHVRTKRGIFWDFFQKMVITKNLIVDVSMQPML